MLSDARIINTDVTRTRREPLNPDLLANMVEERKRQSVHSLSGVTQTQTATATSDFVTIFYGGTEDIPEHFSSWDIDSEKTETVGVSVPTSTSVDFLRSLLQRYGRDERLHRLSPERRVMYEEILKLREEIGPIDFDVVEALRELRGNE